MVAYNATMSQAGGKVSRGSHKAVLNGFDFHALPIVHPCSLCSKIRNSKSRELSASLSEGALCY